MSMTLFCQEKKVIQLRRLRPVRISYPRKVDKKKQTDVLSRDNCAYIIRQILIQQIFVIGFANN